MKRRVDEVEGVDLKPEIMRLEAMAATISGYEERIQEEGAKAERLFSAWRDKSANALATGKSVEGKPKELLECETRKKELEELLPVAKEKLRGEAAAVWDSLRPSVLKSLNETERELRRELHKRTIVLGQALRSVAKIVGESRVWQMMNIQTGQDEIRTEALEYAFGKTPPNGLRKGLMGGVQHIRTMVSKFKPDSPIQTLKMLRMIDRHASEELE